MKPLYPNAIQTVDSFFEAVDFLSNPSIMMEAHITFRGQCSSGWGVLPSLFRAGSSVIAGENELIRDLLSTFPTEFFHDQSMFDRLVRMQHFGLPTRLLDVTKNPLVALYFAVNEEEYDDSDGSVMLFHVGKARRKYYDSDTVSCLANLANLTSDERDGIVSSVATKQSDFNALKPVTRLHQFIRSEKPYFTDTIARVDLFRPVYVVPKMSNPRLVAQFGSFIIFGLDHKAGPSYKHDIKVQKLVISANAKTEIRRKLETLGFDGATLFPEIDKAAKQIVKRLEGVRVVL